jgi:hypothetical protein
LNASARAVSEKPVRPAWNGPGISHREIEMTNAVKLQMYRDLIDHLVDVCHDGQGQIGARRVRAGVWNRNATAEFLPDQHEVNLLLARMPDADREILARLMSKEVELGVFETLKALEQFDIAPFETGYEGSPFNDFVGRLDDWQWPEP